MWKSDHDSNKEKQGSNRSNEEQAVSEKKRPRDKEVTLVERKERKKEGETTDLQSRKKKSRLWICKLPQGR